MTAETVTRRTLDREAVAALSGPRTPKFLATRDAHGTPNVVPVLSLEAADESTIIFAELMIVKTRRNLEADPRLSILVLTADLRGWEIRGRFREFQRTGAHFDRLMSSEDLRYNAYSGIRSAGVIDVTYVQRTFRFSRARLLADTVLSRWLARRMSGKTPGRGAMPPQVEEKFGRLRAVKATAYMDVDGHPECRPALAMVPAGASGLVWGGCGVDDPSGPEEGAAIAAAVITVEPIAYQVKGEFRGWRRALGRWLAAIDVVEAYSASPPLPGNRLPAVVPSR